MIENGKVRLLGIVNIIILGSYLLILVILPFPRSLASIYFLLAGWIQLFIFTVLVTFIFSYQKAKDYNLFSGLYYQAAGIFTLGVYVCTLSYIFLGSTAILHIFWFLLYRAKKQYFA